MVHHVITITNRQRLLHVFYWKNKARAEDMSPIFLLKITIYIDTHIYQT